ncbi:MAG: glycoside hydrolase family 38 [Gemmatimonadetes bacterium]|nr:glycoside hydrolase family 38 [Gemmatimonadota bacterium]
MSSPLRVLVIAHTHWDREWYRSAGRFRQRLVALVDELLDDPPPPGEGFLLDGQGIVLDDYLAVRPERAAELGALLRTGQLEAGPWYVLADELIPGGEALVRNLLAGRDVLRALRAQAPPVLYCPDAFGHPAIIPDLAAGFGCELVVTWRGYGGARWPAGNVVRWRGAAGAEVLMHHLPPAGYELGSSLPVDDVAAAERWSRLDAVLRPRSALGATLLLNGADHHARQRGQTEAVRALGRAAAPTELRSSTLREASATIVLATRDHDLPEISGELRDSYGYTWTLQGTLGARAAQKRRNAQLERSLVRDVEPWLALSANGADSRARALVRHAWRTLLEGHPHDTLCGTSIDSVAVALDARHADAHDQIAGLQADAVAALLGHDAERARHAQRSWKPAVAIRNRAARARGGVVELSLSATIADVAVGPGSSTRQGERRRTPPWRVTGIPLQILARSERIALTESPRDYPDADLVAEARALGWLAPIAGYGVETFAQRADGRVASGEEITNPVLVREATLDNGILAVEVSAAGHVRLVEHATGRVVEQLLSFDDEDDVGDLYTAAIRDARPAPTVTRVRVVHRGPLRGEVAIEYRTAGTRSNGTSLRARISLDADARFVRIRVDGRNSARDHRLRVRIATGLRDATTLADAAFHPAHRAPVAISSDDERMEQFVPTAPLHRWVSRYASDAGATVFSDGLAEYESIDDGSVAITLVRAVGALSRHDLPERPGHAAWPADTPLAQCEGDFSAELAVALHGADSAEQRDEVERMADDVLLPLIGETLRSNLDEPHRAGGLELIGDGLAFSAAMPARAEGWVVLRCVNRRDERVDGAWRARRTIAEARLARLDETPLAPLALEDTLVRFVAEPRAIVTVLARWSSVGESVSSA